MQISDIKQRLPITKVLAYYGIKIDKNNHINCPFHSTTNPAAKYTLILVPWGLHPKELQRGRQKIFQGCLPGKEHAFPAAPKRWTALKAVA